MTLTLTMTDSVPGSKPRLNVKAEASIDGAVLAAKSDVGGFLASAVRRLRAALEDEIERKSKWKWKPDAEAVAHATSPVPAIPPQDAAAARALRRAKIMRLKEKILASNAQPHHD